MIKLLCANSPHGRPMASSLMTRNCWSKPCANWTTNMNFEPKLLPPIFLSPPPLPEALMSAAYGQTLRVPPPWLRVPQPFPVRSSPWLPRSAEQLLDLMRPSNPHPGPRGHVAARRLPMSLPAHWKKHPQLQPQCAQYADTKGLAGSRCSMPYGRCPATVGH